MLNSRQQQSLRGIGIAQWRERATIASDEMEAESFSPAIPLVDELADTQIPEITLPQTAAIAVEPVNPVDTDVQTTPPPLLDSWEHIIDSIHACSACELAQNCTQKVPGVGNQNADLMIIGEGPGRDEDIQGEPFVGRSGQLLDRMLAAIGIGRDQVFITNIVKCRPPNNRDPKQEEAKQCQAFLQAQIEQIKPRVILSAGRVSAQQLLETSQPVGKLIENMHSLPGSEVPVKVTYHPAYLLRTPSAKSIAWQDLKLLHKLLQ